MTLTSQNIIVLDLETARSAEDCRRCFSERSAHGFHDICETPELRTIGARYSPIGWDNKTALGLSIGCYYDYRDSRMHWFDMHTLEITMRHFVDTQPFLVSFNGIAFDFALMRGVLRQEAERIRHGDTTTAIYRGVRGADITVDAAADYAQALVDLCDDFKTLCATSYDILAEIWKVDPQRKFEPGLNSLDAISHANGLGAKEMTGAQAPRLWQQGRYAEVLQYCQGDVEKTKALFEMVCGGQPILRGDGKLITLRHPFNDKETTLWAP